MQRYEEVGETFLERPAQAYAIKTRLKAVLGVLWADGVDAVVGAVAPGLLTAAKIVTLCATPDTERDIAQLRSSHRGVERLYCLQRLQRGMLTNIDFADGITRAAYEAIVEATASIEADNAAVTVLLEDLLRAPMERPQAPS